MSRWNMLGALVLALALVSAAGPTRGPAFASPTAANSAHLAELGAGRPALSEPVRPGGSAVSSCQLPGVGTDTSRGWAPLAPDDYRVSGQVTDQYGKPVVAARICTETAPAGVSPSTAESPDGWCPTETDSQGNYEFWLWAGKHLVRALKACYDPPADRTITLPPNATNTDFVLSRRTCPYSISGRVTDDAGHGVDGVHVQVTGPDYTYTETDTDGRYMLPDLVAGTYTLQVHKFGWESPADQEVTVPPSRSGLDLVVTRPYFGRIPVVFVHGWMGLSGGPCDSVDGNAYFIKLDDDLPSAYYRSYATLETSPCYTPLIEDNVWQLKDAIDRAKAATGQSKVILVAHSMGGLVSRAYIEGPEFENDVSELFTFGTPHQGVPIDYIDFLFHGLPLKTICLGQQAVCQFSYYGMRLFNKRYPLRVYGVTYHALSGAAPSDGPFTGWGMASWALLGGWNDGAVHASSGQGLTGYVDRKQTDETHGIAIGSRNYFTREGGWSVSRSACLLPVLDREAEWCGTYGYNNAAPSTAPEAFMETASTHTPVARIVLGAERQTYYEPIAIDGGPAVFIAGWDSGAGRFTLLDPYHRLIDPAYAASHPEIVQYRESEGAATYVLPNAAVGRWSAILQANSWGAQGTIYTTFATIQNGVQLSGSTDRDWYPQGGTAVVTALLSPAPTSAAVTATITPPSGVASSLSLASIGGGRYQGNYFIPAASGYVHVTLHAEGESASNAPFERSQAIAFQIMPKSIDLAGVTAETPEPRGSGAGGYKALAIELAVVTANGDRFGASADLVDQKGNLVAHSSTRGYLPSGGATLVLRFEGSAIYRSGRDGPYTLTNLILTQETNGMFVAGDEQDVYRTQPYRYQAFGYTRFLPSAFGP